MSTFIFNSIQINSSQFDTIQFYSNQTNFNVSSIQFNSATFFPLRLGNLKEEGDLHRGPEPEGVLSVLEADNRRIYRVTVDQKISNGTNLTKSNEEFYD